MWEERGRDAISDEEQKLQMLPEGAKRGGCLCLSIQSPMTMVLSAAPQICYESSCPCPYLTSSVVHEFRRRPLLVANKITKPPNSLEQMAIAASAVYFCQFMFSRERSADSLLRHGVKSSAESIPTLKNRE